MNNILNDDKKLTYIKIGLILIINSIYIFLSFKLLSFSYKEFGTYIFNHEAIDMRSTPVAVPSFLICIYLLHILNVHSKNKDFLNQSLIYKYTKNFSFLLSFILCISAITDILFYCLTFTLYFFHIMRLNITIKNKKITYYLLLGFFNFLILIFIFAELGTATRPTFLPKPALYGISTK